MKRKLPRELSFRFAELVLFAALNVVLVLLDHLLDHLTAHRTCLTRGKIAVVALSKVNAYFACSFHLELIQCCLCFGYKSLIACHNCSFPGPQSVFPFYGFSSISIENTFAFSALIIFLCDKNMNGNFCIVFVLLTFFHSAFFDENTRAALHCVRGCDNIYVNNRKGV